MTVIANAMLVFCALLIIGAIIEKLSEKHCPNDGQVMKYDSYGGFECPKCKRYEKNGKIRHEGRV